MDLCDIYPDIYMRIYVDLCPFPFLSGFVVGLELFITEWIMDKRGNMNHELLDYFMKNIWTNQLTN